MKYGQLKDPNAPIEATIVETETVEVKEDVPPVPKKASEEDLDQALSELTKKKD